ncbi:MAG TPA: hypothetical protein VMU17_08155, partial [Elusimicrobiota bacterium]|nr:hypothetical protein [Elusimicrobiota bacterium]
PNVRFLASVEGVYHRDGPSSFRIGGQWQPASLFALRAGYRSDTIQDLSALAGFSVGFGLKLWGQELSYAWVPLGDLGDTNYISLVIRFGKRQTGGNLAPSEEEIEQTDKPVRILPPRSLEQGAPEAR